jgi:hypothetical protein
VRPHDTPQAVRYGAQERVTGSVSLYVVRLLQTVDINECDYEFLGSATGADYLALQLSDTGPAAPDTGQLIGLRGNKLCFVGRRQRPFAHRTCAFHRRPNAITGRPLAVSCGVRTIARGAFSIMCPTCSLLSRVRSVLGLRGGVPRLRYPIALECHPIPIIGLLFAGRR